MIVSSDDILSDSVENRCEVGQTCTNESGVEGVS